MKNSEKSSFRDPSGFIYYENNKVMRQINPSYFKEYHHLMDSGLYQELVDHNYLVEHKEVSSSKDKIILEVEKIPYVSYPYEWTFEQIKAAALLTISINQIAMKHGMILKDASIYNVQFLGCRPVFIDTLSFMFYTPNTPWGAYGQFSRHFIAPLVLMKYVDVHLNCLLSNYIDGIPFDVCCHLLGRRGGMISYLHIKMQNKSVQKHNRDGHSDVQKVSLPESQLLNMFSMIERQIKALNIHKYSSEWMDYYDHTNYLEESLVEKEKIIQEFCHKISLKKEEILFDLGANNGRFSSIAQKELDRYMVAFDIDYNSVEENFMVRQSENMLPLLMDINNPSSAIGFANEERSSFMDRGCAGLTLVLAFIHHIVISNNIPFEYLAKFLSSITRYLIIEFVPKEDSQVQILLKTREDIFSSYDIKTFQIVFGEYFTILEEKKIKGSDRTLFLMEVKHGKG